MEFKDYYEVMGVSRDATQDKIKRSYRKLARKYHPDVSKETDAEERFKEVQEAYEVLKDPEKRAAYDNLGRQWHSGEEFRPPPGWDAGFEFGGGGFTAGDTREFSDFFEALFGGRHWHRADRTGSFQLRGEDRHARILIDLEDAYHGAARAITLRVPEATPDGHVRMRERNLNVRIPPGVRPGQQIRLTGQGAPGMGDGKPGDLYLEIEFKSHRLFYAEGRDVYLELPVTPWEAALGATVSVPTLGTKVDMKIPKGSQAGGRLRLKGRGLPGQPPGDQYVVLRIMTPPATTAGAEAVYRKMAKELPFNPRANMGV
ncbi:MAG: DnaJ domain-containing protein [Gammaproteobacteria bacterium]|nr:DnaJ domain-containing protein [Gammaproteobacteria bacterium]